MRDGVNWESELEYVKDLDKLTLRHADEQRARNLLREMGLPEDVGRVKLIADAQEVWRTGDRGMKKVLGE